MQTFSVEVDGSVVIMQWGDGATVNDTRSNELSHRLRRVGVRHVVTRSAHQNATHRHIIVIIVMLLQNSYASLLGIT